MEQKSHNLQTSESSNSISQLPESNPSLSLPSEPPDVRNWFSSYVYESPALGSDEVFVASLVEASQCRNYSLAPESRLGEEDENLADFDKVAKVDSDLPADPGIDEVPDTLQSETQLSEPPDVRNWFSSYAYESPSLSIDIGGEDSSKEIRHVGKCLISNSSFVNVRHQDESLKMIADFSETSSQLSEPPDVRNWFSSYAYESPLLSIDIGGEDSCKEIGHGGNCLIDEKREPEHSFGDFRDAKQKLNKISLAQIADSLGSPSSQLSEPPHISNWFSSYVYESPELNTIDGFRESLLEENEPISSNAQIDDTDPLGNSPSSKNCCEESKHSPHPPTDGQDESIKEENLSAEQNKSSHVDLEKWHSNKSGTKKKPRQNSTEEPNIILRSLVKENERPAETNSDGFVYVKKRVVSGRSNDENDTRRPWSVLKECRGSKGRDSCTKQEDGIKRRPLAETTNRFRDNLDDAVSSAGKWKCPLKNKPNLGPPLKQLRLEKWVRLVGK